MKEYVTVRTVGNSTVITIPSTIKTEFPVKAGERVLLSTEKDRVVITRENHLKSKKKG